MKKIFLALLVIFILSAPAFAEDGTNRTIKLNTKIRDELETSNETDYFNFDLSKSGSIQIDFDFDIEGKYYVRLIDTENSKEVQYTEFSSSVNTSSGRYSKSAKKIRVPAGEYQVKVSGGWGAHTDEEYVLKVNYESESGNNYEKEYNNDAKNAMLISTGRRYTGNLSSSNDVDYYMVELDNSGSIEARFEFDYNGEYNVTLFSEQNGSLKEMQSTRFSVAVKTDGERYTDVTKKLRVPEGNYYVKVSSSWNAFSNEDYTLALLYNSEEYRNVEREPNDSAKTATDLYIGGECIGNLNSNNDVDYYSFGVSNPKKFCLQMNVPNGAEYYADVYVEKDGNLSKIRTEKFASQEIVNLVKSPYFDLTYGRYYLKLGSRKYSNEDYTIAVMERIYNNVITLQENNPYMMVNNITYPIDGERGTSPIVEDGRTLLPIRAIIETFGGTVKWDESSDTATLELDGKIVKVTNGKTRATVNGSSKTLDVAPKVINGRTMLPLRFVMENLDCDVEWNEYTKMVTISY